MTNTWSTPYYGVSHILREQSGQHQFTEAQEYAKAASRAESDPCYYNQQDTSQSQRLHYIHRAMDALLEAEALLCRQ